MVVQVPFRRVASFALGLACLVAVPAGQLLAAVPARAAGFDASAAEQRMFQDINADRLANGLPPVAWNPVLAGIARDAPHVTCGVTLRGRSQDMIDRGYMAHQIPLCNVYVSSVMSSAGINWTSWGENIVWNTSSDPVQSADQGNTWLMNDPPHKANILGNYNQVGVGVAWAPTWTYGGSTYQDVALYTMDYMTGPLPAPNPASATPLPGWSAWAGLQGAAASAPAVVRNTDGRLEMFARQADGSMVHDWQDATSATGWSGWIPLPGVFSSDPVPAVNPDGRLEVFAVAADGTMVHDWQTPASPTGWSGFAGLGGAPVGTPSVAVNADKRLEMFTLGTDHQLWHDWQTPATASGWSGWAPLGGSFDVAPTAALNSDGRLETFATGTDGALWHLWQTPTTASGWSSWASLGGSSTGTPSTVADASGHLAVVTRGSDGSVELTRQDPTSPSGWASWASLGGSFPGRPVAGREQDGDLVVFVSGADGSLWHERLWTSGQAPAWSSFSGSSIGAPTVATNADGRLEAFALATDRSVWHVWESAPSSGS